MLPGSKISSSSSSADSLQAIAKCLWDLLVGSCSVLENLKTLWPVRDRLKYKPVREAAHSLMTFLLHTSRTPDSLFAQAPRQLGC